MTLQKGLENEDQLQWAQKHELLSHLGDILYTKVPRNPSERGNS